MPGLLFGTWTHVPEPGISFPFPQWCDLPLLLPPRGLVVSSSRDICSSAEASLGTGESSPDSPERRARGTRAGVERRHGRVHRVSFLLFLLRTNYEIVK